MSFDAFRAPPPGAVVAVVPGRMADPVAALSPVVAEAAAAGRDAAIVRASLPRHGRLSVLATMRGGGASPPASDGEAWLRPLPELIGRLDRPWHELGHTERYLTGVAAGRLRGADFMVLELPSSRLPGPRVLQLIVDLAREGCGLLWIERRLRLVAAFDIEAWLLDDGQAIGPLAAPGLLDDERAWRLCFGGSLD